jgi:hypothetical protein
MRTIRIGVLFLLVGAMAFASEPKASDFDTTFAVELFMYDGSDCTMRLKSGTTSFDVRWHYSEQQIRGGCLSHRSGEQR